ncbi:U32 family peptidase [Anaerosporobacter faecicola]|uniref:U32 family peptidase n=1 Tax=Anaerosporobacter faecicola TaxID=2718714 RepID=UPI00143967A0|nr:U32 family peptidase [Anaerosporobacter faecicola]
MRYYNVPADFKSETLERYCELSNTYPENKVMETYGQITVGNIVGSGRAGDLLPEVDMNKLSKYVNDSKQKGIDFNYTLNATCLSNREFTTKGIKELTDFLDTIYEIGINKLTIAMPSLIELVNLSKYQFEIKASTLCQVINANKASSFKKLGVDRVVVDESINRDFNTLRNIIGAFGSGVEVIVNVICNKNCIYRMFHQNQVSHDSSMEKKSTTYYSHRCIMKRVEDVGNLMRMNWIRPEDIKYYSEIGINNFKIQGRQAVITGDIVKTVESYFRQSFDGNLMELLDSFSPTNNFKIYMDNKKLDGFIKPFVEKDNFCKNNCDNCNYCNKFIEDKIDYQKVSEVFQLAREFYPKFDDFINMVVEHNYE